MSVLESVSWWPVLAAAMLAFAEAALGLGAVLPGEVAIVALASGLNGTSTTVAILAVALAASTGDHVGYVLGRVYGTKLAETRLVEKVGRDKWDAATRLTQRYGVPALLVSRLLPFVRTLMPAVAGVAGLNYRRFVIASILGSLLWSLLWVGAGGLVSTAGILDDPQTLIVALILAAIALLAAKRGLGWLKAQAGPAL
ncbi:MAG: VTT domain-containing protein [Nocardioides sp.]